MFNSLWKSIARGWRQLVSRKIYIFMMLIVPIFSTFFFLDLMKEGLPLPVPVSIVDLDRSDMSRQITRNLRCNQYLDITDEAESYHDALDKLQRGETFGFFYIPRNFQRDALNGRQPTISYYTNTTIFVPASMAMKGFTTIAVTTTSGMVKATLQQVGVDGGGAMVQPVNINNQALDNPWLNYSIYLSPSFLSGLIALLVMIVTTFSLGTEIKNGTSPQWLSTGGNSVLVAIIGKLAPQTIIFSVVGIGMEAVMFRFLNFPLHNHAMHIITAMVLLVIACQAFGVIIFEIVPNMRLSVTICSLTGILSFSVVGFSYPVGQMYGAVGIFAYIIPLRHFFMIYSQQALMGIPIYYSRIHYIALLIFPLLSLPLLPRLKKHLSHPVYVP